MPTCVFCDKSGDLNTEMTITLEGGSKVSVHLCDTHADDATPKTVREAYLARQTKIAEVLAQARALGLNVAEFKNDGGILVPTAQPRPPAMIPPPLPRTEFDLQGDDIVPTSVLDSSRGMLSVGGATDFGHVSSHSSHSLSELKKALGSDLNGKAKLAVVEAREGMPIVIAETRVDGTGTTRMRISKKEDDSRLQVRFKKMADQSMRHNITPDFARAGYKNAQAECPVCRGACVVKQMVAGVVREITCPKCAGLGSISTV